MKAAREKAAVFLGEAGKRLQQTCGRGKLKGVTWVAIAALVLVLVAVGAVYFYSHIRTPAITG
ncbi:MAG: hypothetical protein ACPLQP_02050, partial [Moorellaceae bacterium]